MILEYLFIVELCVKIKNYILTICLPIKWNKNRLFRLIKNHLKLPTSLKIQNKKAVYVVFLQNKLPYKTYYPK